MHLELHLTSLDPPEGDALLPGLGDVRPFVGWLGLLHLLWEVFSLGETPEPCPPGGVDLETPR